MLQIRQYGRRQALGTKKGKEMKIRLLLICTSLAFLIAGCSNVKEVTRLEVKTSQHEPAKGSVEAHLWANVAFDLGGVDIVRGSFGQVEELPSLSGTKDGLADLGNVLPASFLGEFKHFVLSSVFQGGKQIRYLPSGYVVSSVLYANEKLLSKYGFKPAQSYEELARQGKELAKVGLGCVIVPRDSWARISGILALLVGRFGGPEFVSDLQSGRAGLNDQRFGKAIEFYHRMLVDRVIDPKSEGFLDVGKQFMSGKAAYLLESETRVGEFELSPVGTGLSPAEQKSIGMEFFPPIPGQISDCSPISLTGGFGLLKVTPLSIKAIEELESQGSQDLRLSNGSVFPSRVDVPAVRDGLALQPLGEERLLLHKSLSTACPVFSDELTQKTRDTIAKMIGQ